MNRVVGRGDSERAVAERIEGDQGDFLGRHADVSLEHLNPIAVVRGDQLRRLNRIAEFSRVGIESSSPGAIRVLPGLASYRVAHPAEEIVTQNQ